MTKHWKRACEGPSWTCQESVRNLGTPKLAWDKVQPQSGKEWPGIQKKAIAIVRENYKCQWEHWPFLLVGESVATPLWGKCEDETRTPKSGNLESSRTPATSKLDYRRQNTLPWGALYTIGKFLKFKCRKWPRMSHLDIFSTSYGWKKGRESKCQFDSRPQKVWNWPDSSVCRWSATHRWKALEEIYKFVSNLIPIRGLSWELWVLKVLGVQTETFSGLFLRSPRNKSHLDAGVVEQCREHYMGEGGGFPWVQAVVSQVSPCCPWLVPTPKVFPKVN